MEFEKGTVEALTILRDLGYLLIVVTNQSGIARQYYTEEDLKRFHQAFQRKLSAFGLKIDKFYYCPHHPEKGIGEYKLDCSCRKPKPGMLEQGISEFEIDRKSSYMVGDKYADVQAGMAAGVSSILVRTGYGKEEEQNYRKERQEFLITYWPLLRIENKGRVCKMKLLCQILQKDFHI